MDAAMSDARDGGRARVCILLVVTLLLVAAALAACTEGSAEEDLERRAQRLDRTLICPLCPSETIDQSQVLLAAQMRATVRERLSEGWSEDEIRQYFVDRYGERVLASPPKEGFNLVAWLIPPVIVVVSLLVLALVVREMLSRDRKARAERARQADPREDLLRHYLSLMDRERGAGGAANADAPGPPSPGREGEL